MPTRPPRAFTSGLPVHQVTLKTAGYYYGVTRERTPAGLSPASPATSFAALPPPGLPRDRNSPASPVLSRRYDALPPSCRTSFPSFGSTSVAPVGSLLDGRVRRRGLELVTRCLHPGIRRGANRVLPSSWGIPIVRLHMIQSDPGRMTTSDQ